MADLCRGCGTVMTVIEEGFHFHPTCIPEFTPVPGMSGMSFFDLEIKEDLIEIIRWAQANSQRSQQVTIGCSEVGHECDRRIGYRIAGISACSDGNDPWPSIVGTSIHSWMEQAIGKFQEAHNLNVWHTEMAVQPSPLVSGHTDLYRDGLVLDFKFPSPDNLRKMRENGPPQQYKTQVQLYGLGHLNAGRRVERVGVVALGRQGWLKDMYVWTTEFDRSAAHAALERVYAIGRKLIDWDITSNPQRWQEIPATPTRLCSWCPWYHRDLAVASDRGCPGKVS